MEQLSELTWPLRYQRERDRVAPSLGGSRWNCMYRKTKAKLAVSQDFRARLLIQHKAEMYEEKKIRKPSVYVFSVNLPC